MGLKSPWFQFLVLCLCVSTVANSKPLSMLKPEECAESCNTAKQGIVHKVETRDVREDYTAEYRRASDTNHEELFNMDSLNDFDIEETDDDDDGDSSLDEKTSSGDVAENIGGARADNTVYDGDGINVVLDPELPETIIHDTVDDTSDDNPVVDDDDVAPEDDDNTFAADDDDESGDHDDYANDLVEETQDIHDNDDDSYDDDDDVRNSSDDDNDTFDVDDDANEDDSDVEEMLEDDDDRYDDDHGDDVDHVINTPEDDDTYDEVVNLDHINDPPDVTFGVDDLANDHRPDSNGDNMEGPIYIPEEHPQKYVKANHHHHNPLNKHPDTKLGRLLKKHQSTDMAGDKSVRKNLRDDIDISGDDDDKDYDFQVQKRKDKFLSHKGRRTLSLDENSDFDHVEKTNYPEEKDQEDGNSAEKSADNADNADKQFVGNRVDLFKQAGSVSETTTDGKDASALVQEDPIENEEEEDQRAKVDSSVSDYEETQAVSSPEETDQHYEEDKIEGEET